MIGNERQLEDWIVEHYRPTPSCDLYDRLIDRQIELEHGILDLLGVFYIDCSEPGSKETNPRPYVNAIELKHGEIKEAHVGQLLRYMIDVRRALQCYDEDGFRIRPGHRLPPDASIQEEILSDEIDTVFALGESNGSICGTLVGGRINEKTLAACDGANIQVLIWEESAGHVSFHSTGESLFHLDSTKYPWVKIVHDILRDDCVAAAAHICENEPQGLFAGLENEAD